LLDSLLQEINDVTNKSETVDNGLDLKNQILEIRK